MSTRPPEDQLKIRSDRRKMRRKTHERWSGASAVHLPEEQRRKAVIRKIDRRRDKRRSLAIHFKRRKRGTLTTHHIGRYLRAWDEHAMFLQMSRPLLTLSKNLAMICSLVMLACCRYKADALRAERKEIADWLNVHRDTVTRLTAKLVKLGLLCIEERFTDARIRGRNGRTLHHPQIGNWYSPGPALRAIWQVVKATGGSNSYPQEPGDLGELVKGLALNNSLDRKIDPYRRIGSLGSNTLTSSDKESATRTVIKKPAAPAENTANKRAKLAGPSTSPPYQPARSSKSAHETAQIVPQPPKDAHIELRPSDFAATLLEAYTRDPELAELLARALLRADYSERIGETRRVGPSG